MTFKTHREFAITFIYFATFYIYSNSTVNINYFCLLIIMLSIGAKGALFPDVDHYWQNVKEKTVCNWILNKLIHLTGGKHRSWQTHSLDLCLISGALFMWVDYILYEKEIIDYLNYQVILIILLSFYSGWVSHLIADMLTTAGVYILILKKKNIKLVPKKLFRLEFKTGDVWEEAFYRIDHAFNVLMFFVAIAYPFIFDAKYSNWLLNILHLS